MNTLARTIKSKGMELNKRFKASNRGEPNIARLLVCREFIMGVYWEWEPKVDLSWNPAEKIKAQNINTEVNIEMEIE